MHGLSKKQNPGPTRFLIRLNGGSEVEISGSGVGEHLDGLHRVLRVDRLGVAVLLVRDATLLFPEEPEDESLVQRDLKKSQKSSVAKNLP